MPHVFISYIHENKEEVKRLCDALEAQGVNVWLDRNDIEPGTRWQQAIRRAIQDGAFFIACFSKEYSERPETFMNEELTSAIERLRKFSTSRAWFIPVKLNECDIPDRSIGAGETLEDIQYVELYKDWNAGIREILDVIQPARINELMEELKSPFARVRIDAAHELGQMAGSNRDKDIIDALINALHDENDTVRANAAYALSEFGQSNMRDVIYALLGTEADTSNYVRRITDVALARICSIGEPAIPTLIEALKDESVGLNALDALWHIGKPVIGLNALDALCHIGEPAIPALIEALKDEDELVRLSAAHELKENISTPEALKAVEEYEKRREEA